MSTQKELMNQASTDYGVGGSNNDFFSFDKSGEYRLRLLTAAFPIATHFFGKGVPAKVCYGAGKGCPFHGEKAPKDEKTGEDKKPSVKFIGYVIDRKDNKVKFGELPWSVISAVTDLQDDSDYAFADFPMPYDIKVKVDKDAAPANMYKTLATPSQVPVESELMKVFEEKMTKITPEQYVEKRKNKQLEADSAENVYEGMVNNNETQHEEEYPEYKGEPTV